MSKRTRTSTSHSIFGSPLPELPHYELPTKQQVGRYIQYIKDNKYKRNKDVIPDVSEALTEIWKKASIPVQPIKNVKTKLLRLVEEASVVSKQGMDATKSKKFISSLGQLFDIAGCQCADLLHCKCEKNKKVPHREHEFLIDQRTGRHMKIGGVDVKTSQMIKKRKIREDRFQERREEEESQKKKREEKTTITDEAFGEETSSSDISDDEWKKVFARTENNIIPIPTIAMEADRHSVSNRAAAAISTAALFDYGIINSEDRSHVIDHHKVWRARQKLRRNLTESECLRDKEITALFFDGRRDTTLTKNEKGNKWYGAKEIQDHYVLVGEPGTFYLDHLTIERGTGAGIADGLMKWLVENDIKNEIKAVGADSTATNTGYKNGAIRGLECQLHHPLQWIICSLHLNELPLRHLCRKYIGPTESGTQWKGPLGTALTTCETLPVSPNGFHCIAKGAPLPNVDVNELSRDQAYLYRIISAIRSGVIDNDLLHMKPGPISHARWLTTASRICRLYVATEKPNNDLYVLTEFVVCHYGPIWFHIKFSPKCMEGSKHLLEQINLLQILQPASEAIAWQTIQRNSYWAHQENVILAMLADVDQKNRKLAIDRIKKIREITVYEEEIRYFRPPKINKSAKNLTDLLPPEEECRYEPPLTMHLSNANLQNIINEPLSVDIPCHSQGVERCVRMVTEASGEVYGKEARDGYIRAVLKSRDFMPSFETKRDFNASADK